MAAQVGDIIIKYSPKEDGHVQAEGIKIIKFLRTVFDLSLRDAKAIHDMARRDGSVSCRWDFNLDTLAMHKVDIYRLEYLVTELPQHDWQVIIETSEVEDTTLISKVHNLIFDALANKDYELVEHLSRLAQEVKKQEI